MSLNFKKNCDIFLQLPLLLCLGLESTKLFAEEKTSYPELQVSPLASERIKIECEIEDHKPYAFQLPITVSSFMTLMSSIAQSKDTDLAKDPEENSQKIGMMVGGGWLALNLSMGYFYRGYFSASKKIEMLPGKTEREKLIRERIAEEEIKHLSRIGKTMKWGAFTTQFLTNFYMLSKAKKDSNAAIFDSLAIVASFFPIIFSNQYEEVAKEQNHYKKKIFGQLSWNFLFPDSTLVHGPLKINPGLGFTATF
jgi:hypothetical protein